MSKRVSLNSDWHFTKQPLALNDVQGLNIEQLEPVQIPHCWNAVDGQTGGDNYHRGLCWYKKTIEIDAIEPGKSYYLEVGAANSVANAYLNGEHLGEHRGGYSRFRFDVTNLLTEGSNELAISVDNSHIEDVYPLFADFTFYGGIYRDVNLVIAEDIHFDMMDMGSSGVYVSQREVTEAEAKVEVKALVTNNSQETATLHVQFVDRQDQVVAEGEAGVSGNSATVSLTIDTPTYGRQQRIHTSMSAVSG